MVPLPELAGPSHQDNGPVVDLAEEAHLEYLRQVALQYLRQIREEFSEDPHILRKFVDIIHSTGELNSDIATMILRLSTLFERKPDLLVGISVFLPRDVNIERRDGQTFLCVKEDRLDITRIYLSNFLEMVEVFRKHEIYLQFPQAGVAGA